MNMNRLTFVLKRPCDTEPYTVTCPELPGLITEGDTVHEALEEAKDAYDCVLGLGPYNARLPTAYWSVCRRRGGKGHVRLATRSYIVA